jgi:hypothetical protein
MIFQQKYKIKELVKECMESDIVEVKEIVEKVDKRYEQKLSKRHKNRKKTRKKN